MLVDEQGEVFGLTRELGIKAAEVKRFLGAEINHLPSVEQAKESPQKAVEQPIREKATEASQGNNQPTPARQDEPKPPYQQTVNVTFDTKGFEAARAAQQLTKQQQQEQAERDKQERVAQRLKEWEEQQQSRKQRGRDRGLEY